MKEEIKIVEIDKNDFLENELQNKSTNIVKLIEQIAERYPEKNALIDDLNKITYQNLNQKANQLARYLQNNGIKSNSKVGVCIPQSVNRIIAFLAILKTGASYLPIDGDLPQARIQMMVTDSEIDLMLTVDSFLDKIQSDKTIFTALNLLIKEESFKALSPENLPNQILPHNPAYIIYTSGSTGIPKGVIIGHQSFLSFVEFQADLLGLSNENTTLQFASPSFDAAVIDIWTPLIKGATIYLYPNNKIVGEPLLDFIVKNNIDTIPLLPPMVLASLPQNRPIGNLKTIAIGGEACTENTVKAWYKKIRLINSYGPTEATVAVSNYEFKTEINPRIIGSAMPFAKLLVLDEALKPTASGSTGELYIGGDQLALGYLNRPEDTKKAFIQTPK